MPGEVRQREVVLIVLIQDNDGRALDCDDGFLRFAHGVNGGGAFASSWYGVPALAGLARHRPARWLANPGPRRLKPELRTNNSRMRPLGGALGAF